MFYVLPIVVGIISLPSFISRNEREGRIAFILFMCALMVLTGLRKTSPFPDMVNYEVFFFTGEYYASWSTTEGVNIGYQLLNNLFHWTNSFQVFVFFVTLFIFLGFTRTIDLYSPYLFLSLFIFLIVDFHLSCFLLRQYLAVTVCLLSIPSIIDRRFVLFLVCMIVAISLHTSAVVFVPLYFLYRTDVSHPHKVWLLAGFIVASVLSGVITSIISGFLNNYYQHYLGEEGTGSLARLIMKCYLVLLYLYALKDKVWEEGINQVVFYMMLTSIVICSAGLSIPIFFRLRMVFSISEIIGIPIILKYCKDYHSFKRLIVDSMIVIYIIVLAISFNNTLIDNSITDALTFFWIN